MSRFGSDRERSRRRSLGLYELEMALREEEGLSDFVYDEENDLFRFPDGRFAFSREWSDVKLLREPHYHAPWSMHLRQSRSPGYHERSPCSSWTSTLGPSTGAAYRTNHTRRSCGRRYERLRGASNGSSAGKPTHSHLAASRRVPNRTS
jgi:hypothetical protein